MRSAHHVLARSPGFAILAKSSIDLRSLLATAAFGLLACSGDFHSDKGLQDMECNDSGCFRCDRGSCEEYNCSETHQCPMDRVCSASGSCVLDGSTSSGRCSSHEDCRNNEICTLEGVCVASPGGGPGKDASDASDTAVDVSEPDVATDIGSDTGTGDTGPGDIGLPDHPDDVCRTNADCGVDGTCVNGGCYFACSADSKCPPGQACSEGQCRASGPENQCTFNGECGTTHACLEGTCYLRCEETLDCLPHTRCATGICIADTTPVIQCSGPGSCSDGHSCVDGKCLAPCIAGACDAGFACDLGYCARATTCFEAADCGGKDCVDGACAP